MGRRCFYVLCWCLNGYAWALLRWICMSIDEVYALTRRHTDCFGWRNGHGRTSVGCKCGLIFVCLQMLAMVQYVAPVIRIGTCRARRSYTEPQDVMTSFPHCMFDWEVLTLEISLDTAYQVWLHTYIFNMLDSYWSVGTICCQTFSCKDR